MKVAKAKKPKSPNEQEEIQRKIIHLLRIYPVISPTMLQAGLGPSVKPDTWRPALDHLVSGGRVVEAQQSAQTPAGRYNTYTKLSLPNVLVVMDGTT